MAAPPYERLKGLVASRNALVHAKSIPMPVAADGKIPRIDTDAFSRDVLANARTAMMAVILISLEMDKRFGDITINPLPSFDKESVKHSDFSAELRSLISDCRGTLKKSWAKDAPKKKTA